MGGGSHVIVTIWPFEGQSSSLVHFAELKEKPSFFIVTDGGTNMEKNILSLELAQDPLIYTRTYSLLCIGLQSPRPLSDPEACTSAVLP